MGLVTCKLIHVSIYGRRYGDWGLASLKIRVASGILRLYGNRKRTMRVPVKDYMQREFQTIPGQVCCASFRSRLLPQNRLAVRVSCSMLKVEESHSKSWNPVLQPQHAEWTCMAFDTSFMLTSCQYGLGNAIQRPSKPVRIGWRGNLQKLLLTPQP